MLTVEALSKKNSPGVVILGENLKANCRLITTCVLNMILFLFPCVIGDIMSRNSLEHGFRQIVLLSIQGTSQCEVARILGA